MDFTYIFTNTLIYGIVALALAVFYAYGKFLNMLVGSLVILSGYLIHRFWTQGFSRGGLALTLAFLIFYFGISFLVTKFFKHKTQREVFGIIFTRGAGLFIENIFYLIFGPGSIGITGVSIPSRIVISSTIALGLIVRYLFAHTSLGKIYHGIEENDHAIQSLGTKNQKYFIILTGIVIVLLAGAGFLLLTKGNIKISDQEFYLIKGLLIMILLGIKRIQYVFPAALIYVVLEYLLFIQRGLPISYKETFVTILILVILIFKPDGIFERKKIRKS